jgi:small-conductance mechanosensitive channel/CRP-like cAMP-binding protein
LSYWSYLQRETLVSRTIVLVVALLLVATLVALAAPDERRRLRRAVFYTVAHLTLLPVIAFFDYHHMTTYAVVVRVVARLVEVLALVGLAGVAVFSVFLRRVRFDVPRILQDVITAGAAIAASLVVISQSGFNLSGVITTSAVITAIVGLSLQETLGNVVGGLALQTDNSVRVGDWIKVGELGGQVAEIRWRFTSIKTRNGELVLVPNGFLLKNQVVILGKGFQPGRWRRWVWFNVDFRFQPTDVIETVEAALRAAPIQNVAKEPLPQCILMDIGESQCRYAVRYWLTDLAADDPTDSVVRTRVFFALARARIQLSMPAYALFLTQHSDKRDGEKSLEERQKCADALRQMEVFRALEDADIQHLAAELRYAPFAAGEVMTRQGAEGHWLYLMAEGTASVRVAVDGGLEREVARLGPGHFFGEMSLMTGRPREATVVAVTDVECFRLGAASFSRVIHAHPEKAEDFAEVLAARQASLEAARKGLSEEAQKRHAAVQKAALTDTIKQFFGLD